MQDKRAQEWSASVDGAPREVVTASFEIDLEKFDATRTHRHRKAQLLYTVSGLLHCVSGDAIWAVPARCAMWIPSGRPHAVFASSGASCLSICIEPREGSGLPADCCTIAVGPLLAALITRACGLPRLYDPEGPAGRLLGVLVDEIAAAPVELLQLPMPRDARLLKVAESLRRNPAQREGLQAWARLAALSERSLSRLFREETGMSLGDWRHRLQVLTAVGWLASGRTVQTVAFDLGYASASGFIKMFKETLKHPPARYMAATFGDAQVASLRAVKRRP
jgi:AraC-like DNA-binding protein